MNKVKVCLRTFLIHLRYDNRLSLLCLDDDKLNQLEDQIEQDGILKKLHTGDLSLTIEWFSFGSCHHRNTHQKCQCLIDFTVVESVTDWEPYNSITYRLCKVSKLSQILPHWHLSNIDILRNIYYILRISHTIFFRHYQKIWSELYLWC